MKEEISILYIDDDVLLIDYFKTLLEGKYSKVITATSGFEGVNKFFENTPDIVIVDIIMPDIDGVEVAVKIKEKYRDTEIIAVSSSDSSKNLLRAINAGIRNFILKPVMAEKLYSILDDIVENIKIKRELKEYREKLEETVELRTGKFQRISEKLISEIEERESLEKRYFITMGIMEQSPIGIIVTDTEYNIEYVNQKALSFFERDGKKIHGRKIETVFNDIDMKEAEMKIKKCGIFNNEKYIVSIVKGNGNFKDLYQIIIK